MSYKKHAYLIMAHNEFELLKRLLAVLDDEDADVYLHIDKKAKQVPMQAICSVLKKSTLFLIPRQKVSWGGSSQIDCVMSLLRQAVKKKYQYYHLISGVDFPIKTKTEREIFLDAHIGDEFVWIDTRKDTSDVFVDRVKYYYFFHNKTGRNTDIGSMLLEKIERVLLTIQRKFKVDRTRKLPIKLYKGSNWFSITHGLAVYLVSNSKCIHKWFRWTICADEVFVPSLAMASPFRDHIVGRDLRENDWNRGNPYTFTEQDFDLLIKSDNFFARKLSYDRHPELVELLEKHLKE